MNKSIFSTVFNYTTNSYKYYWWLAILQLIKENDSDKLLFNEISLKMLSLVWYPINFYKISLGKQDQLTNYVIRIKQEFHLDDDISESDFIQFLNEEKNNRPIKDILKKIMKYVPYRFIRPWIPETFSLPDGVVNSKIIKLHSDKNTIYNINEKCDGIYFKREWLNFIRSNFKIIEDFTMYNLFKYVEKNNPEISNISVRLWRPKSRKLVLPTRLWRSYITDNTNQSSVFSDLSFGDFNTLSLDHYLPWSYITHDKLWNLHPVEKSVNSSKSNSLPDNKYLEKFSLLQYDFMQYIGRNFENELLDYALLFNTNNRTILDIAKERFVSKFKGKLESHIQIASNMGFKENWNFKQ